MTDTIRVTATGAGVSYYPEFIARELGLFAEENLDVQTVAPGHGPWVARALDAGEADIALGGIWRPLMYRNRLSTYWPFAQLCIRCPSVLMRRDTGPFTWNDLEGKDVLVPDGAPSPWMLLKAVLQANGVNLDRVRFIQDFMTEEATELFRGGLADYYLVGPPVSDKLEADGIARYAATLADGGGRIPWSVYYSTREFQARGDNPAGRFSRAISRALTWTLTHEPEEAPGVPAKHFPSLDAPLVYDSVRRARSLGVWTDSVSIDRPALAYWQTIIRDYGLIADVVEYEDIVAPGPSEWAEDGHV